MQMDNYEDINNENIEQGGLAKRPEHITRRKVKDPNRFFVLRNWLNSIFILGAIVGMCMYFFGNKEIGTYIVLASMVVKFVECIFRVMK